MPARRTANDSAEGRGTTTVSVITVCYNEAAARIRTTIDSILAQDHPSVELIVIDGGSKGETLRVFDAYRSRIDHFVSEPDAGIFDAMNKGLAAARGDWISFMNVGDYFVSSTALSELVNERTAAADIVYGDLLRADTGLSRSPHRINRYLLYHSGICHQAMVARRSLFEEIGNFDASLKLGGDPDWLLRALRHNAVFMYVPTVVCHYVAGGASADQSVRKRFRSVVTKRHYTLPERVVYGTALFFQKCAVRIATLDFRVPVAIREWLKRST